ncbi:tryptophan halogenase family protein [Colwellia sp. C1TZA3]|uniref:tryptophan halogenase family protein n=1 Tax=Colwellia sp. C1TZA3 TaxID=2508879 RepID=UPI0011B95BB0|nr:tryptophan halogenase family protein [Colwellia sp. C1TZA3]TWX72451.1 tryptophan 7-halogenase [Colwellia sp. C1TZA3]
MSKTVKNIIIIGGGTAGWLTAAIIAAHHKDAKKTELKITLVESSDIPTIGVGEGTWPTMKNTFHKIGLKESDVFKKCHAAFKQGAKFVEWVHGNGDFYYHPFTVPLGYGHIDLAPYVSNIENFARESNFQYDICEAGLAPRNLAESEYQGQCNYGYHLDAGALAELLKRHCIDKLNVEHIVDTLDECISENGERIDAVVLNKQGKLTANLFVDCSGSRSLLLGQTLNVPFKKVDHVLFNNRALAMQVPYESEDMPLASHTIATAQNAGWIWDIGLTSRRGVGHVYASDFLTDEEAEQNLRNYLGEAANGLVARKISFEPGHREQWWKGNCVAIGMAAGFVEPLEATAIMLVELSARYVAENLPADESLMPLVAKRFNKQMAYRWQRIVDFLKFHYMLTKRTEPYWQAHCDPTTFPDSLKEDLSLWQYRGPTTNDFTSAMELFPAASYQYVLYGMEFKPDFSRQGYLHNQQQKAEQVINRNEQLTQQMLQSLPPHRDYIEKWLATST